MFENAEQAEVLQERMFLLRSEDKLLQHFAAYKSLRCTNIHDSFSSHTIVKRADTWKAQHRCDVHTLANRS